MDTWCVCNANVPGYRISRRCSRGTNSSWAYIDARDRNKCSELRGGAYEHKHSIFGWVSSFFLARWPGHPGLCCYFCHRHIGRMDPNTTCNSMATTTTTELKKQHITSRNALMAPGPPRGSQEKTHKLGQIRQVNFNEPNIVACLLVAQISFVICSCPSATRACTLTIRLYFSRCVRVMRTFYSLNVSADLFRFKCIRRLSKNHWVGLSSSRNNFLGIEHFVNFATCQRWPKMLSRCNCLAQKQRDPRAQNRVKSLRMSHGPAQTDGNEVIQFYGHFTGQMEIAFLFHFKHFYAAGVQVPSTKSCWLNAKSNSDYWGRKKHQHIYGMWAGKLEKICIEIHTKNACQW